MIHNESYVSREVTVVKQLTIRGFSKELARRIRNLAQREGISLNRAALRLMRRGAGLEDSPERQNVVGSTLDDLIGTWSDEEASEFMESVEDFGQIDESMWK
jgi:hypothetical protein